ncbi:MAG: hypothetical protein C0501_12430 [Isosphaera sp.]|nr:hypothetical protein [Isosphaera sp.]
MGGTVEPSIFVDFHLPNAPTWFYFSLLLAVSLFARFARPLSLRNLDLLTLFLFGPGFLILQEAHARAGRGDPGAGRQLVLGYAWLLAASAYWFARSVLDLALVRRPAAGPNLTTAGMVCLGLALFVGQASVAVRRTADPAEGARVGARPAPLEKVQDTAAAVVSRAPTEAVARATGDDLRFWGERTLCMVCHAAVVVGLLMIGVRHFQDRVAGIGMGTLYLLVPYTAFDVGRQLHHVWPTAFTVWAVYFYRRPGAAGWLLGLAAGTSLFPLVLFPLWVGFYARRGAGRFAGSFVSALVASVLATAAVLWWDGRPGFGLSAALNLPGWQPWGVATAESLWTGVRAAYRLPVFVLFVAFLAGVTVWPSPKNLSHLIALSAALLVGVQFWHADRGGMYVLWYLPLLLLVVFRPNLAAAEPPAAEPGGGVMAKLAVVVLRQFRPARPDPPKELAV